MAINLSTYGNKLLNIARVNGVDPSQSLTMFLDYLIGVWNTDNIIKHNYDFEVMLAEAKEQNGDLFMLMLDWFMEVTKEMENGQGWVDFFGGMYEAVFQSKGKAGGLGQFYTPDSLCNLMADVTGVSDDARTINDCACGSGRTLLAAWAKMDKEKYHYFDAADIDSVSCKMCALNMMVHGMIGEVRQQDSLSLDKPVVTYKVNEIRTPFPTPYYSIRIITN